MKKIKITVIIFILSISLSTSGQKKEYYVNDIFFPDLKGHVKSFTDYIISNKDTLRELNVCYSKAGFRTAQYIRTTHPEMGFNNDSTCYKVMGNEITSYNCKNGLSTNTVMTIGGIGLINEIKVKYPEEEIIFHPNYSDSKRLNILYTARVTDKKFQYFATLSYTYNEDGSIKQTSANGGSQAQGNTEYFYNSSNLLIKTIRSDGNNSFTMEFSDHDNNRNWTKCKYQNGIIVTRTIDYY